MLWYITDIPKKTQNQVLMMNILYQLLGMFIDIMYMMISDLKLQEWSEQDSKVKEILAGKGILFYHNTDKENNAICKEIFNCMK